MFKNLKISAKLLLIGGFLIILPIVVITYFAVTEAGDGMRELEMEQLENRTAELAEGIDNVLRVEKKLVTEVSIGNSTIAALVAADERGADASSDELAALNYKLFNLINTSGLGEDYQDAFATDTGGIILSSSNPAGIGVSVAERIYFQKAVKGTVSVGIPMVNKVTGDLCVGIGAPVYNSKGRIVGTVAVLLSLESIGNLIVDASIGETGYAFLADAEGLVIAHPDESLIMETNMADLNGMEEISRRTLANENGVENYIFNGIPKTAGFASVATTGWSIVLSLPDKEYLAPINAVRNLIIIIGVVCFIVAMIIFIFFSRSITKPLIKAVDFAGKIALGDLSVSFDHQQRDEIGILADALRRMLQALQYKAEILERIADGDLTVDVEKASDKDGLGESMLVMKNSLTEIMTQIITAANQVTTGADQVSQASQDLSQGATEQASSLEEISSSINEINSQSKQNAENATEANALAKQAAGSAESGNLEMKNLTAAMGTINESSDEIKKVVKVIDDIAFQINLLALNANVEAARAGKYGKGFAVVAEEVRNLAVKSADAVKETTAMVEESIRNIEDGNKSVDATAKQLEEILGGVTKVASFLDEIAVASKEQAQGIDQITEGLDQIEQVTQANTASAEESASASEELAGQAQELQSLISRFKIETSERLSLSAPRGYTEKKAPKTTIKTGMSQAAINETGIRPVAPSEVIKLDDEDFDRF